jgi:hypothetical protein
MKSEIRTGTWWVYIGGGDGRNVKHRITSVTDDEVTTWSDPNHAPFSEGYSWLSGHNEFLKNFRPVA